MDAVEGKRALSRRGRAPGAGMRRVAQKGGLRRPSWSSKPLSTYRVAPGPSEAISEMQPARNVRIQRLGGVHRQGIYVNQTPTSPAYLTGQ